MVAGRRIAAPGNQRAAKHTGEGHAGVRSPLHPFQWALLEGLVLPRQGAVCAGGRGKLVEGTKNGKCLLLFLFNFRN